MSRVGFRLRGTDEDSSAKTAECGERCDQKAGLSVVHGLSLIVLSKEVETGERITQIQSVQPTKEVNQPCFFPVRDGEPIVFIFFDLEQETKASVGVGANKVERNQTVC